MMNWFQEIKHEDEDVQGYSDVLGIELGGTFSRIGIMRKSTFELLPDEQGRTALPNYVAFQNDGSVLVGFEAQTQAPDNLSNTIYDFRRLMGRRFGDRETQEAIVDLPYTIVNIDGKSAIKITQDGGVTHYTPECIAILIFQKLKAIGEAYLGTTISRVIISVPADSDDRQKDSIRTAAKSANLDLFRFGNVPMLTAMAYGIDYPPYHNGITYLLCDLNANDYDLTILTYDTGIYEILETVGERTLKWDVAPTDNLQTQTAILRVPQTNRIIGQIDQLLLSTKITENDLGGIMVTGDLTHLSELQQVLKSHFPHTKILVPKGFKSYEAIVYGATIWGDKVSGWSDDSGIDVGYLMDVSPVSLGIELSNGGFAKIIHRNVVIPTKETRLLSKNLDDQKNVVVKVYEGEREIASHNNLLGTLELAASSSWWKKEQQIELVFEVDANGILFVTLGIKGDAKTVRELVVPSKYTQEDIDKFRVDEETFQEADLKQLEVNPLNISDGVNNLVPEYKQPEVVANIGVWQWLFG